MCEASLRTWDALAQWELDEDDLFTMSKVVIILDDQEFMPGNNPAVPLAPMHDRNRGRRKTERSTCCQDVSVFATNCGSFVYNSQSGSNDGNKPHRYGGKARRHPR